MIVGMPQIDALRIEHLHPFHSMEGFRQSGVKSRPRSHGWREPTLSAH
jgi:hypothetical protein